MLVHIDKLDVHKCGFSLPTCSAICPMAQCAAPAPLSCLTLSIFNQPI